MAKKRTGLQSEIAGIFSGVPVPKKGGARSRSDSPAKKPDIPASKPSRSVMPKPVSPQQQPPVAPIPKKIEEPVPAAPRPKVIEIKAPEQVVKKIPKKIPRRRKDKIFATKAGVSASRQKAAITLLLFFSTALVIVLLRSYYTSSRNANSGNTQQADAGISSLAKVEINWPIPPVYSADLPDPMVSGPKPETGVDIYYGLEVVGIVVSDDRKFATIGTQTVQEGDIIKGTNIKVKKINPDSVEFEEDGNTWIQKTRERKEIGGRRK